MKFCVDKAVVGGKKHLLYDNGQLEFIHEFPENCFVYGSVVPAHIDLKLLLGLGGIELDDSPGDSWETMMRSVLVNEEQTIPWSDVMPKRAWKIYVQNLCNKIDLSFQEIGTEYYHSVFLPSQKIFDSIEQYRLDYKKKREYIKKDGPTQVLESFTDVPINYSRLTSTGRLIVTSGPEILRLKKKQRDIIKSRYEDGEIVSLDYVSLEPRLCLYLAGKPIPDDVYQDIIDKILFNIDRKTAKKIVLSVLYGAGTKKLQSTVSDIDPVILASYILQLKKYFGIKELTRKLITEQSEHGFIRNYYGKVLRLKNPVAHKLYNAYVQSTAVDVALLGFSQLSFDENVHPIFIIHDALLIDKKMTAIINHKSAEKIPGFDMLFGVELTSAYLSV